MKRIGKVKTFEDGEPFFNTSIKMHVTYDVMRRALSDEAFLLDDGKEVEFFADLTKENALNILDTRLYSYGKQGENYIYRCDDYGTVTERLNITDDLAIEWLDKNYPQLKKK